MSGIKTGFSRLCITTPLGISISGYYEKCYAKGVLDDLYVSAALKQIPVCKIQILIMHLVPRTKPFFVSPIKKNDRLGGTEKIVAIHESGWDEESL